MNANLIRVKITVFAKIIRDITNVYVTLDFQGETAKSVSHCTTRRDFFSTYLVNKELNFFEAPTTTSPPVPRTEPPTTRPSQPQEEPPIPPPPTENPKQTSPQPTGTGNKRYGSS